MNILVLDDEKEIADLVEVYLKNENYNVFKFYDSKEALKCIENQKLDVAILDVMIKDVDGFEICKMIRDKGLNFPVIMLTAKIEDKDKIQGLLQKVRTWTRSLDWTTGQMTILQNHLTHWN